MRTRTRFGATTFAAAFLMAAFTVLAGPAQAAPVVKISKIYYNSPGSDTGSNASLNAEYVTLQNTTTTARTVTGWTLRDKTNHVYKFPSTTIKAKSTVTLRTGKGTNSASTRYWQQTWYVWNNTGDTAYLRNTAGTLMHSCAYGSGAAVSKTC